MGKVIINFKDRTNKKINSCSQNFMSFERFIRALKDVGEFDENKEKVVGLEIDEDGIRIHYKNK